MISIAHQRWIDALTYKQTNNESGKMTGYLYLNKFNIPDRSDLPDVQRNLFPHPV